MEEAPTTVSDSTDDDRSVSDDTTADGRSSAASKLSQDLSDSSKHNAKSSSGDSSKNYLQFNGNRTEDSEMITVEIDLTDPDDLSKKLDMVDLTDEEADMLLERAQQLNMWLRHQLMKQSSSRRSDSANEYHRHSATCIVSAPAAAAASNSDYEEDGTAKVRRSRTFSGSSALPPLVGQTVGASNAVSYKQINHSPAGPSYSRQRPPTMHRSQPMSRSSNMVGIENVLPLQLNVYE